MANNKLKSILYHARPALRMCGVGVMLCGLLGPAVVSAAASNVSAQRAEAFASAAQEFGVPVNVLLALSYNESRWEAPLGASMDGGYGVMDLRGYVPTVVSGRDGTLKSPA